MADKIRRVDFSPDEWLGGTVPLSLAERGLYITACALMYSAGGPIPVDHLKAACRDHGHTFNAALKRLIDLGKLIEHGSQLINKRVSNELQNALKRSANARQNVLKRHAKDRQKEGVSADTNGLDNDPVLQDSNTRAPNHQPSTISKKEPSPSLRSDGSHEIVALPAAPGEPGRLNGEGGLKEGAAAKGTRLPPNWQPDQRDCEYAHFRGLDPDTVAESFCDYWHAKPGIAGRKTDWHATWRTWCRNEASSSKAVALNRDRPSPRTVQTEAFFHAANDLERSRNC